MVDSTKNSRFISKRIKNAKRIIDDAIRTVQFRLLALITGGYPHAHTSAHLAGAVSSDTGIFVELRRIRQWRISTQFLSRL